MANRHVADVAATMTVGAQQAFEKMVDATASQMQLLRREGKEAEATALGDSMMAATMTMLRLGGRLIGSSFNDNPGIEGYADRIGIAYGVVLHRDFTWSVNS